ncbi:MAG: ATP-binding protein, partial [Gammaproteobacteria bacterium]|nr:ATP-binding protein [Gammaproteobacteria bacterium]
VADLLRNGTMEPAQRKLVETLSASGESLLRILNDVLDFSKIEAEQLDIRPAPFALHPFFTDIENLLGVQARGKGLSLVVDIDPELPDIVNADRQRLAQVLLNLGTNAVKFTDSGHVTLSARALQCDGGSVLVEFAMSDTGIGIAPDAIGRLFTPFTQLDRSNARRGAGTGLGLVIAQRLVGLMGGVITVESSAGEGSRFRFAIDLAVADRPVEAAPQAPGADAAGIARSLTILVAEDNPVNQAIVTAMLDQIGHRAVVVNDGREALAVLADRDCDLVLMDCQMPVMDGFEATRCLRAGEHGVRQPGVPVIALTANAMAGDREACLAAGMDDFLPKPVSIESLRRALGRTLDRHAAR